ncbi:MAG: phosphodiester glycosidase family protein, partial [Planctomycetia bacterium]
MPSGRRAWLARAAVGAAVATTAVAGGAWYWWRGRPVPPPVRRRLAPGLWYERQARRTPRLHLVHVVTVDWTDRSFHPVVTPAVRAGDQPFDAQDVVEFMHASGAVAAVNGDYFAPFHDRGPFDYEPRRGRPTASLGPSAMDGVVWRPAKPGYFARRGATVAFTTDGAVRFGPLTDAPTHLVAAVSGGPVLVSNGRRCDDPAGEPSPQTILGWRAAARELLLVVVDGRQPGYSEGLDVREAADLMLDLRCDDALRLDGGGSSAVAARDERGAPVVLNTPIHNGVPGRLRPTANHFGIV